MLPAEQERIVRIIRKFRMHTKPSVQTSLTFSPVVLKESLSRDQLRLYQLIYNRFLASQMTSAVYETTSVKIDAGKHRFTVAASKLVFDGFMSVYIQEDDKEETNTLTKGLDATLEAEAP